MPKKPSAPSKRAKQNGRSDSEETNVKKEEWSADDLGEQSTYEGTTEISRRLRRGDETVGDPDERDVAGAIPEKDMPHGREVRRKSHKSSAENQNEKRG
jgi:hypothetical protein